MMHHTAIWIALLASTVHGFISSRAAQQSATIRRGALPLASSDGASRACVELRGGAGPFGGASRACVELRGGTGPSITSGAPAQLPATPEGQGEHGGIHHAADQTEVEDIIDGSGDQLVVLYFTATWCMPCQVISPVFAQIAKERAHQAVFIKVDVDKAEDVAANYDVFQMPTFIFVRNGDVITQFSGANEQVLRSKVSELLGGGTDAGPAAPQQPLASNITTSTEL